MRYFIELAYNGTAYHGWQSQPNALTVQQLIEEAMSLLLKSDISIVGAGRTDTGVHARQMFAHFDHDDKLDTSELVYKLNSILPRDIAIKRIFITGDDAHARFGARSRTYQYLITTVKDPFANDLKYCFKPTLNLHSMNEAANILLGSHNFKCFSRAHSDVKTYTCEVTNAVWTKTGDQLKFEISADRFLRNMVRAVVGTLIDVGQGKISLEQFQSILESQDRSEAGASAPAQGLYLTKIEYPKSIIDE